MDDWAKELWTQDVPYGYKRFDNTWKDSFIPAYSKDIADAPHVLIRTEMTLEEAFKWYNHVIGPVVMRQSEIRSKFPQFPYLYPCKPEPRFLLYPNGSRNSIEISYDGMFYGTPGNAIRINFEDIINNS